MSMSTTSTTINKKVAVAQLCSTASKLDNLINVARCACLAKNEECVMLFLPECFGFIGESAAQTLKEAEPPIHDDNTENESSVTDMLTQIVSGSDEELLRVEEQSVGTRHTSISLLDGLRAVARASGMWISAGGMHVAGGPPARDASSPRVYNTHVILDSEGHIKADYRKVHLFDVSIPGKVDLRESRTTAPGKENVLCDSPIGKSEQRILIFQITVNFYLP
jgi:predicted amidohydrolase